MSDPQPSLFDSPTRARTSDPATSHEAAGKVTNKRRVQVEILRMLRRIHPHALCDDTIRTIYRESADVHDLPPVSDSGLRTRRSELVSAGLVVDSGERATLPSGRRAIRWTLTPEGMKQP